MDIKKFERILRDRAIYFCSARNFQDKFEAEYAWGPTGHKKYLENIKDLCKKNGGGLDEKTFMAFHLKDIKDLANKSYVSCWNKNTNESEAMWKLYCTDYGTRGIVIKTDLQKLKSCLAGSDKTILFKAVQYVPNFYVKKYNPEIEEMLCHKRKAFDFENEYRAFFVDRDLNSMPSNGMNISIDPENLISEIRISPFADKSLKDEVLDLIKKYELNIPVKKTEIQTFPILAIDEEIIEHKVLPNGTTTTSSRLFLKENIDA